MPRPLWHLLLAISLAAAFAHGAQGASWELVSQGPPSPRTGPAMAYDVAGERVVLFGGEGSGGQLLADTWELAGGQWTAGPAAPPGLQARADHAMVADEGRECLVLFGGRGTFGYLADTWELSAAGWLPGPAAPAALSAREDHGMAYDEARGLTVLYGGDDETSVNGDTWEYDGAAWSAGPGGGGPGPREGPAMTYDPVRGRTLLFGGDFSDARLWTYDGTSWADAGIPAPRPAPRVRAAMAFDATRGVAILFGGMPSLDDTWECGAAGCVEVPAAPRPDARHSHVMAFDALSGHALLLGGAGAAGALGDTWSYGGSGDMIVLGAAAAPGNANRVRTFSVPGVPAADFHAYPDGTFGAEVGSGALDAVPPAEILTGLGPGPTHAPRVRAFTAGGTPVGGVDFYAFGTLSGGVIAASGEVEDADATDELLAGPGPGAVFGPHVRGFDRAGGSVHALSRVSFYAYGTLKYGVGPAGGHVDAAGVEEIVTGAGAGIPFSPHVRGFTLDGGTLAPLPGFSFVAFPLPGYGVRIAAGDVDGDARADVAASPGPGGAPAYSARLRGFAWSGSDVSSLPGFDAVAFASRYGGRVGLADLAGGPDLEAVAGSGPDPARDSTVKCYSYDGGALVPAASPFAGMAGTGSGINVGEGLAAASGTSLR